MGFFANLCVVDCRGLDRGGVSVSRYYYGAHQTPNTQFRWGIPECPPGFRPYAEETIFCNAELKKLPGYHDFLEFHPEAPNYSLKVEFMPEQPKDGVLLHILLPERYVPRKTSDLMIQPNVPTIRVVKNRLAITYATAGDTLIQFKFAQLRGHEKYADANLNQVLNPVAKWPSRVGRSFGSTRSTFSYSTVTEIAV